MMHKIAMMANMMELKIMRPLEVVCFDSIIVMVNLNYPILLKQNPIVMGYYWVLFFVTRIKLIEKLF
jgi:hypothetical protein